QGSLTVGAQAVVVLGQVLARCGNSGRSPQPHLHMHVQVGAWLGAPTRPFHLAHVIAQPGGEKRLFLDYLPAEATTLAAPRPNPVLARALHRAVGRSFTYALEGEGRTLTVRVELDLHGATWLVSERGARIALTETDALIALHTRQGAVDPAFDAFVLTATLTPLCEEALVWRDAIPLTWLPTPWWLGALAWLLPGVLRVESRYARRWEPLRRCWEQEVTHQVGWGGYLLWSCRGVVELSEALGWTRFRVQGSTGGVEGRLVSHGLQADHGISGWRQLIGGEVLLPAATPGGGG
ncbi:MAG: hypothetical protein HQL66_08950, partial [Magnetococcales bacterium]|nr:hypothetical protein [Magnetococcales bacterium]